MPPESADPALVTLLTGFLAAAFRVSSPLLIAGLGETIAERSGVINLGMEGAMLAGALAAALSAGDSGPWYGVIASVLVGACLMAVFAVLAIWLRADQIITGTALTLGAMGLTGALFARTQMSGSALSVETFPSLEIPLLGSIPVVGPALFRQPFLVYFGLLLVPLAWFALYRTRWGLRLRAAGESPSSARTAGVGVERIRTGAVLISGALGGLAGGTLVLAQVGTFAERMTAGRGFVAIAIVVLGRWHPLGVALAALLFGGLTALQYFFQALGLSVPYQLFLMLPYLLTVLALAGLRGRASSPAALGRSE